MTREFSVVLVSKTRSFPAVGVEGWDIERDTPTQFLRDDQQDVDILAIDGRIPDTVIDNVVELATGTGTSPRPEVLVVAPDGEPDHRADVTLSRPVSEEELREAIRTLVLQHRYRDWVARAAESSDPDDLPDDLLDDLATRRPFDELFRSLL